MCILTEVFPSKSGSLQFPEFPLFFLFNEKELCSLISFLMQDKLLPFLQLNFGWNKQFPPILSKSKPKKLYIFKIIGIFYKLFQKGSVSLFSTQFKLIFFPTSFKARIPSQFFLRNLVTFHALRNTGIKTDSNDLISISCNFSYLDLLNFHLSALKVYNHNVLPVKYL